MKTGKTKRSSPGFRGLVFLCVFLTALLGPKRACAARVTITVQFAYGAVAVGGVGLFIAISGSWETPFAERDFPSALLEIRDRKARWGIPLARPQAAIEDEDPGKTGGGLQFDVIRLRF